MKNVLSIAGSDCSAGAGIQADLKNFYCKWSLWNDSYYKFNCPEYTESENG